MIKKLTVSALLLIGTTNLNAESILGDIEEYVNIGGGGIIDFTADFETNVLDLFGGAINNASGDLLGVCYDYNPPNFGKLDISINVCGVMDNVNFNFKDPCAIAPDLSVLGFTKHSGGNTKNVISRWGNFNLGSYCNNVFKAPEKFELEDVIDDIDLNRNVFAITEEEKQQNNSNTEESNQTSFGSVTYSLEEARENKYVINAVNNNDYESSVIYSSLLDITKDDKKPKDIDVSKLNVSYGNKDEYEKSIQRQVDAFAKIKEQVDLNKFKENCLTQFEKVNSETEDFEERKKQKEAVRDKLLDEYKELVEKYKRLRINQRLLLEYKEAVVLPTKDFVSKYEMKDRAKVIYAIEKQKAQKALIITQVNQELDKYTHKSKLIADKTLYSTNEFDKKKAFEDIKKLIDDGGEEGGTDDSTSSDSSSSSGST